MKILFCGTMVPNEIELQVKEISAAGNRFQNNFIKYLSEAGNEVFQWSYLGMRIPEKIVTLLQTEQTQDPRKRYVIKNGKWLKSLLEYRRLVRGILGDMDAVICYNVIYAWLLLPKWAAGKHKKSIAILADYSESISYRSLARKCYAWLQLWSMRRFDKVIGLSANIENLLKKNQEFILMEGGIHPDFYGAFSFKKHEEEKPIILMYSGLLAKVAGVDLLLEAMQYVKRQDIQVVLTGKGALEEKVLQVCASDSRLCYAGNLTYEKYMERLQDADVLLNPRDMNLPENQNNFPSKIMDYLTAGKPIISTRFAGWKKFADNIVFTDCTAKEFAAAIDKIIIKDTDEVFTANRRMAASFLWNEQVKKVL